MDAPYPYVLGPAGARQRERLLRVVLDAGAEGVHVGPELEDRLGLTRLEIELLVVELAAEGQIRWSYRLPEERRAHLPVDPLERLLLERCGAELHLFARPGAAAPNERELLATKVSRCRFPRPGKRQRGSRRRKDLEEAVRQVAAACGADVGVYVRTGGGVRDALCERVRRRLRRVVSGGACVAAVLDIRGGGRLEAAVQLAGILREPGYARALVLRASGASAVTALGLHEGALHGKARLGPLSGVMLEARAGWTPEKCVARELENLDWPAEVARDLAKVLVAADRPLRARDLGDVTPTDAEREALDRLRGLRRIGRAVVAARV
jgi:hypothetical protein